VLDADTGYASYLWSDGSTAQTLFVDSSGIYWVEATTVAGCISRDTITIWSGYTISGKIKYGDTTSTSPPISDIIILLKNQNNITIASYISDSTGYFEFRGLPSGTYYLEKQIGKPWGGGNSLDALMTVFQFIGTNNLTGINLLAADVNDDGVVNTVDALNIQQRFVGMITTFFAGDWIVENTKIVISGNTHAATIIVTICVGDVDGSHIP